MNESAMEEQEETRRRERAAEQIVWVEVAIF